MDSYVALNGSCFMVTWTNFKNHLSEVGLTQNRDTMVLWNARNRRFILFYHVLGPAWIKIHWNSIWLRAQSRMTSHYIWGFVTTLYDCGGVLWRPLDTFFWALTISWSQLLARVWSGPELNLCSCCCLFDATIELHAMVKIIQWLFNYNLEVDFICSEGLLHSWFIFFYMQCMPLPRDIPKLSINTWVHFLAYR